MMSLSLTAGDVNLDHWAKMVLIGLSSVACSFLLQWINNLGKILWDYRISSFVHEFQYQLIIS